LYALLANESEIEAMRQNYRGGNYGFGHAKLALFELILREFEQERTKFDELIANPKFIWSELKKGADKAKPIAQNTIKRVRKIMGY
jgi:tryptophanyl-tRNA synthetase